jgi:hypothetical protein
VSWPPTSEAHRIGSDRRELWQRKNGDFSHDFLMGLADL